jgi:hypothetical protein
MIVIKNLFSEIFKNHTSTLHSFATPSSFPRETVVRISDSRYIHDAEIISWKVKPYRADSVLLGYQNGEM